MVLSWTNQFYIRLEWGFFRCNWRDLDPSTPLTSSPDAALPSPALRGNLSSLEIVTKLCWWILLSVHSHTGSVYPQETTLHFYWEGWDHLALNPSSFSNSTSSLFLLFFTFHPPCQSSFLCVLHPRLLLLSFLSCYPLLAFILLPFLILCRYFLLPIHMLRPPFSCKKKRKSFLHCVSPPLYHSISFLHHPLKLLD